MTKRKQEAETSEEDIWFVSDVFRLSQPDDFVKLEFSNYNESPSEGAYIKIDPEEFIRFAEKVRIVKERIVRIMASEFNIEHTV